MGRRILVIEDVPDLRMMLQEIFISSDFECEVASNGAEALDLLKKIEAPDVIFLDLMMPIMNGWEFRKRQIQDGKLAGIPVVLLSAGGHVDDQAYCVGAAGYLRKPFDHLQLIRIAESYCDPS